MKVVLFEKLTLITTIKALFYHQQGYKIFYNSCGFLVGNLVRIPFLLRWLEKATILYQAQKGIAEYGDLYYQLHVWIVDTTTLFFKTHDITNDPALKLFRRHYQAGKKADVFVQRIIQTEIHEFVKWFAPFNKEEFAEKHFFYSDHILTNFILKEYEKQFGLNVTLHKLFKVSDHSFLYLGYYYLNLLSHCRTFKLTSQLKKRGIPILFNAQYPGTGGILSNDFFIDEDIISHKDVLFYLKGSQKNVLNPSVFEAIDNRGYSYVFVDDLNFLLQLFLGWLKKEF